MSDERERILAIVNLPEAQGLERTAAELARCPQITVEQARDILATSHENMAVDDSGQRLLADTRANLERVRGYAH